jgi:hypothetical protein
MHRLLAAFVILLALLPMAPIAASGPSACCCKSSSSSSCPLRKLAHKQCSSHGSCSMSAPSNDLAAVGQNASGSAPLLTASDVTTNAMQHSARDFDAKPAAIVRDAARPPDAPPPRANACLTA